MDWIALLAWLLLVSGVILGLAGIVAPGLPGAVFLFLGVVLFYLLQPGFLSGWTVLILAVLTVASWLADFASTALGAKIGGATRWGLLGAALGGFVGLFFAPFGLILGPFFGAMAGDLYARRRDLAAIFKSGLGATLGFLLSFLARLGLFMIMVAILLVALIF